MIARKPLKAVSEKPKKCAVRTCRAPFIPKQSFEKWCSPDCAVLIIKAAEANKRLAFEQRERREIKVRKEKLKGRGDYAKTAQDAFNAYIRARDAGQPCISCGTTADVQYCAGHYRTVGACPELRYEPLNVHRQCNKNCNLEKSGNIVEYRIRLVRKIGAEALAWLEGPHEPKKYTIEDLQQIAALYRLKLRELKKQQEASHV
ncbi:recombination protein NinG [uncultured Pseudomonas sp.]|uniref:recombination protein NinG n=1 Tax=uncultured Pseudomonas sp. TaxID=114707 RepID=UPI0030DB79BC|tara:strand:+ start:10803 stop:11411 length:609 start_codon:yes stop_codon:yes gene_type:complete